MFRRLDFAFVACALLSVSVIHAHNLDQRNTYINFDQATLTTFSLRAAAGQPLITEGDVVGLVMKSIQGPGTEVGAGGYMTFFIPPGTQVQKVEYVRPDGTGGFVQTPLKPASPLPMGNGPIGSATSPALIGLTLGPNALGRTEAVVSNSGTHRGTIAGLYSDTGIFYSTDPGTAAGTFASSGGYDRNLATNDNVLTNNNGESFVPLCKWDAEQLIAFGTKNPSAPIIDTNGRGNTPWGIGSAVAGPQSGYAWSFDRSLWLANPSSSSRMKNSIVLGPWKRIRHPGSTIADDVAGSTINTDGYAYGDASQLGAVVSDVNPLPPTLSLTDNTSPKAIRVAVGEMRLGGTEYVRIELKILNGNGQPGSPFDANGCLTVRSEAFGGDAGGISNGKDHLWRYFDSNSLLTSTCGMLQKQFVRDQVQKGTESYFDLTVVNSGNTPMHNVVLTDPLPSGLLYVSASVAPVSTSPLTWNLGTISGHGFSTIRVRFTSTKTGTLINTAALQSSIGVRRAVDSVKIVSSEPPVDPPSKMRVGNLIFRDLNGNGIADTGEGVNGVTVQLFDGEADTVTATPISSTVTIDGGHYSFHDLSPGEYIVHIPPAMFNGSAPLAGLFSVTGFGSDDDDQNEDGIDEPQPWITGVTSREFVLASDESPLNSTSETGSDQTADDEDDKNGNLTIDLGFFQAVGVGNLVFIDANGNERADAGEGYDGVTLHLYGADQSPGIDVPLRTTITSGGGRYLFGGLKSGNYRVHIPAEMFTSNTPLHYTISIPAGISGDDDVGENGVNSGDLFSTGISSTIITIAPGSAPTGLNGETGIDAFSDDSFDASIDLTVDFGFSNPVGVGNLVFHDSNRNGHYDAGEGVPGVLVELYREGSIPGQNGGAMAQQYTGSDGRYLFDFLSPGSYFVYLPQSNFNIQGAPLAGLTSIPGYGTTSVDDGVDENGLDSLSPNLEGTRSSVFSLANNGCPTDAMGESGFRKIEDARDDNNYNLTIDFGFRASDPNEVGVGNFVFLDANGDQRGSPDEGIDGVTVHLYAAGEAPGSSSYVATTTTLEGRYLFYGLAPGTYFIHIPASMFAHGAPMHRMLSLAGQGSGDGVDDQNDENGIDTSEPEVGGVTTANFTLSPGTEPTTSSGGLSDSEMGYQSLMDQGADSNVDLTIDLGFHVPVAVGNLVYVDTNRDGRFSLGEGKAGVKVELYLDTQSPGFETPLRSIVTSIDGTYSFTGLNSGSYIVYVPGEMFSQSGPLYGLLSLIGQGTDRALDDDVDENGADSDLPWVEGIRSVPFGLLPGYQPTDLETETGYAANADNVTDSDSNFTIDFGFYDPLESSFEAWQTLNELNGLNAPTDDPDGDGVLNVLEYTLGLDPGSGVIQSPPLRLQQNPSTGQIDAIVTTASDLQDVTMTLEYIGELSQSPAGWAELSVPIVEVTPMPNGLTVHSYRSIDLGLPNSNVRGFIRLKVSLDQDFNGTPEAEARSEVWGWSRSTFPVQTATFSNPFLKSAVFAGKVDAVIGNALEVGTAVGVADVQGAMTGTIPYYIEVTSGPHAGHRFEVDVVNSSRTQISINLSNPLNTLTTLPSTLAEAKIILLPHRTLSEYLPPSDFRATNNQATADRAIQYNGVAFVNTWLYLNEGSPKWVSTAALTDQGERVMNPTEVYLVQTRTETQDVLSLGIVRTHSFATPLKLGNQLIAGGWPMDQSPSSRLLTVANGYTGANSTSRADRIMIWNGDATSGTTGYVSHYLLKTATLEKWVRSGDAQLASENNLPLFKAMRGVYFNAYIAKPNVVSPCPWTP